MAGAAAFVLDIVAVFMTCSYASYRAVGKANINASVPAEARMHHITGVAISSLVAFVRPAREASADQRA